MPLNSPRAAAAFLFSIGFVGAPTAAHAQGSEDVESARAKLRHEPTVAETVRVSLEYFRVHPDAFDDLRRKAKTRGWLPLLAAGYLYDDENFNRDETRTMSEPFIADESRGTRSHGVSIGGVWDLRELLFNASEVQVYGLIGVQRDLMLEAVRTYYLRRQLLLRLLLRPPEDPLAYAALEMRVDEFTAILDVLSGGWFSEESKRRWYRRNRNRNRNRDRGGRPEKPPGTTLR